MTTITDQRAAFLTAICANPKDDTPRLIYADWLDEHGEPKRAEFIRVQCELAKVVPCGGYYCDEFTGHIDCADPMGERQSHLRRRERELWPRLYREFDIGVVPGSPLLLYDDEPNLLIRGDSTVVRCYPRRGFVAAITLTADAWLKHADELTTACPLEEVTLTDREPYHDPTGMWCWFMDVVLVGEPARGARVPWDLYFLLCNFRDVTPMHIRKSYDTAEDARADLSRACIAYGRAKAGLPPLEDRR